MNNWREIDTSTEEGREELNRVIAERLGKTVHTADDQGGMEFSGDREWLEEWIYDERGGAWAVPEYATDLNAAASLPYTADHWLQINLNPDGKATAYARVLQDFSSGHGAIYGEAETEALARCKAWLAWKDTQADGA